MLTPAPSGPQSMRLRYEAVVQHDLAQRNGAEAHLVLRRARVEAGHAALHQECGDPPLPHIGVGRRENEGHVRDGAKSHEPLHAVQHISITLPVGAHPKAEGVGTGVRLGQGVGAQRPARAQVRKEAPPLIVGAEAYDGELHGPQLGIECEREAVVCASVAQPFHHEHRREEIHGSAPVLLRNGQAEHAEASTFAPVVAGEEAFAIPVDEVVVAELRTGERDDFLPASQLFLRPPEFHGLAPPLVDGDPSRLRRQSVYRFTANDIPTKHPSRDSLTRRRSRETLTKRRSRDTLIRRRSRAVATTGMGRSLWEREAR